MTTYQTLIRCSLCGHLHVDAVTRQAVTWLMVDCPCCELPGTAMRVAAGWRPAPTRFGVADRFAAMRNS